MLNFTCLLAIKVVIWSQTEWETVSPNFLFLSVSVYFDFCTTNQKNKSWYFCLPSIYLVLERQLWSRPACNGTLWWGTPYKEDNPHAVSPAELSHRAWSQIPLLPTLLVVTAAARTKPADFTRYLELTVKSHFVHLNSVCQIFLPL